MAPGRDTRRERAQKRGVQAVDAAEDILPAVVRTLLRAGVPAKTLRALVEGTITDWQEHGPPSPYGETPRQDLDDLAHVLSIWHTDPRFVDRDGQPRKLRQTGRAPSFDALAKIAIPSITAAEALKRLLIVGVVEVDSRGRLRALRRELVTKQWDELGLWNWRNTARRHLETLEFNYTLPGEGRFERTARSERLPAQWLPVFNRWVREQGADFVQRVDDWLTQHEQPQAGDKDAAVTAGVGVYLFVDEPDGRPQ